MSARTCACSSAGRVNPVLAEHGRDGGASDVMAEMEQRVTDSCVPPAGVLPGHLHDQLANAAVGRRASPSAVTSSVVLGGDELPVPAQNRVWGDERVESPE